MTFRGLAALRWTTSRALTTSLIAAGILGASGCKSPSDEQPAPAASAATAAPSAPASASAAPEPEPKQPELIAPVITAAHVPAEVVERIVNSKKVPAYSGPTGTVRGHVVATGDRPPLLHEALARIPKDCTAAAESFRYLFREGMNRSLADVLVAVTEYDGYVPATAEAVEVVGKGCAFDARTYALTFGQRLDVRSGDMGTYVPELVGHLRGAQLFATPKGAPVEVSPPKPGNYILVDAVRLFNAANVYVLPYATFDVTGLDGRFEIKNVPVGKVKVNALVPSTQATVTTEVVVEEGKTTDVALELAFDLKAYEKSEAEAKAAAEKGSDKAASGSDSAAGVDAPPDAKAAE